MPSTKTPKYWFPARRYGWGWGVPTAWQGWVVLLAYLGLILVGILFVRPTTEYILVFVGYVAALTAALLLISWRKGEPPRWRWGKPKPYTELRSIDKNRSG
mgnify:FL=1